MSFQTFIFNFNFSKSNFYLILLPFPYIILKQAIYRRLITRSMLATIFVISLNAFGVSTEQTWIDHPSVPLICIDRLVWNRLHEHVRMGQDNVSCRPSPPQKTITLPRLVTVYSMHVMSDPYNCLFVFPTVVPLMLSFGPKCLFFLANVLFSAGQPFCWCTLAVCYGMPPVQKYMCACHTHAVQSIWLILTMIINVPNHD